MPDSQTIIKGLRQLSAVLDEAKQLVCNDRREEYGGVHESFDDIARMWSVLFGQDVTPEQVALAMVLLKVCREKRNHKHDNLVDIAGYAALADFIADIK